MKSLLVCFLCLFSWSVAAQDQMVYKTKNLAKPDTTWVFKPQNYQQKDKLPVLFLLHGYSGNYKQWNKIMDAQKYANDYGLIIVCPDGLYSSWYINSPVKSDMQFESFFFDELYPDIRSKYKMDTNNVFISGLSMGGHGALYLFIKRPELFKSAGSTSGGIQLSDGFGKYGLGEILGNPPATSELWQKYSVTGLIDQLKGNKKPFIFDCGADDFFYKSNNALKQKCDELKLNATYIAQPGAHTGAYWAKSIKQQVEFFKTLIN
ncbi:alpha/beta hydrolase family protein [Pedobacter sp. Du54]|uniref:alpha/beta hydrolase n=1 Tax=Pedobacter anseongensis TaxID=3133439 RepID=UPI0030B18FD2